MPARPRIGGTGRLAQQATVAGGARCTSEAGGIGGHEARHNGFVPTGAEALVGGETVNGSSDKRITRRGVVMSPGLAAAEPMRVAQARSQDSVTRRYIHADRD